MDTGSRSSGPLSIELGEAALDPFGEPSSADEGQQQDAEEVPETSRRQSAAAKAKAKAKAPAGAAEGGGGGGRSHGQFRHGQQLKECRLCGEKKANQCFSGTKDIWG